MCLICDPSEKVARYDIPYKIYFYLGAVCGLAPRLLPYFSEREKVIRLFPSRIRPYHPLVSKFIPKDQREPEKSRNKDISSKNGRNDMQ